MATTHRFTIVHVTSPTGKDRSRNEAYSGYFSQEDIDAFRKDGTGNTYEVRDTSKPGWSTKTFTSKSRKVKLLGTTDAVRTSGDTTVKLRWDEGSNQWECRVTCPDGGREIWVGRSADDTHYGRDPRSAELLDGAARTAISFAINEGLDCKPDYDEGLSHVVFVGRPGYPKAGRINALGSAKLNALDESGPVAPGITHHYALNSVYPSKLSWDEAVRFATIASRGPHDWTEFDEMCDLYRRSGLFMPLRGGQWQSFDDYCAARTTYGESAKRSGINAMSTGSYGRFDDLVASDSLFDRAKSHAPGVALALAGIAVLTAAGYYAFQSPPSAPAKPTVTPPAGPPQAPAPRVLTPAEAAPHAFSPPSLPRVPSTWTAPAVAAAAPAVSTPAPAPIPRVPTPAEAAPHAFAASGGGAAPLDTSDPSRLTGSASPTAPYVPPPEPSLIDDVVNGAKFIFS